MKAKDIILLSITIVSCILMYVFIGLSETYENPLLSWIGGLFGLISFSNTIYSLVYIIKSVKKITEKALKDIEDALI